MNKLVKSSFFNKKYAFFVYSSWNLQKNIIFAE